MGNYRLEFLPVLCWVLLARAGSRARTLVGDEASRWEMPVFEL